MFSSTRLPASPALVFRIGAILLIGAVSPLLLAAGNPGEWQIQDLILLLGVIGAAAAGLGLLRGAVFPRLGPWRGLGVDLVLLVFLTLPYLAARILESSLPGLRLRLSLVLLGSLLLSALLIKWLLRAANTQRLVEAGVAAAFTMNLLSLVSIGRQEAELRRLTVSSHTIRELIGWDADASARSAATGPRPDIFILVLDAYAGDSVLAAEYRMDHRPYRAALDSLGFLPVNGIHSNYAHTFASVASLLNFAQLASVSEESTAESRHPGLFYGLIHQNRMFRLLRALGYDTHWMPAPLFGTRDLPPPGAVVHRVHSGVGQRFWFYSPLVQSWIETVSTPGVVLHHLGLLSLVPTEPASSALAGLPDLAADGRPSLVFAHLMTTHHPYFHRPDCSTDVRIERQLPDSMSYPIAVTCLDRQLLKTFRSILTASKGEAIIIAVGDHAPSPLKPLPDTVPGAELAGRFDATAAIYIPAAMRNRFVMPKSEVNLIPEVLRAVFGIELPVQPDTRYYSRMPPHPIYRFVPLP